MSHVAATGETFRPRRAAMLRDYLAELAAEHAVENADSK